LKREKQNGLKGIFLHLLDPIEGTEGPKKGSLPCQRDHGTPRKKFVRRRSPEEAGIQREFDL